MTTDIREEINPIAQPAPVPEDKTTTNGDAAAAILAAGVGSFALGLVVPLVEAVPAIKTALTFTGPVGPLSGKTTVAVVAYLVSWAIAASIMRNKQYDFARVFTVTLVLVALGLVGTFPPFFELFTVTKR